MKARTTILLVLLCLCIFMGQTAYADTDGTELQILEPSYLEIQLGIDWVGTEFQLRTDMGLYPETIQVDENGILHLEIGGSKNYLLSNLSDDTLTVTLPEETGVSSALAQEDQCDTNADKETWPYLCDGRSVDICHRRLCRNRRWYCLLQYWEAMKTLPD